LRKRAESWNKNPQALWWKLFKEINNEKRRNQTDIFGIRKKGGVNNKEKVGDCPFFPDWEIRSEEALGEIPRATETK